jgi:hypothetical protein
MWGAEHLGTLQASTACHGDSFISLYVCDVRTSQETYLWASTASHWEGFAFLYLYDIST